MKSLFIAVLLLTVNVFGAVRIPTEELQLALERGKVLTEYGLNQQQSREEAYEKFSDYIDRKLGQVGQVAAFTAYSVNKKQKISRFVRTLLNFVGWSSHSKALLDHFGKTYNHYINLIDVISSYEIKLAAKNNFKIAKARLQRLALESQMAVGQTYEQADPGALRRSSIYQLLNEVHFGVKVRLIEKADLIVTCGYSPTGAQATDLDLAEDFMDKYSEVKHNGYFHRQHPVAGAARKRTATSVPYLSITGSEVSRGISNRAHSISARIAMLRNALPVNAGGAGNGGNGGDSDSDNDGGNGNGSGFGGDGFEGGSDFDNRGLQDEFPHDRTSGAYDSLGSGLDSTGVHVDFLVPNTPPHSAASATYCSFSFSNSAAMDISQPLAFAQEIGYDSDFKKVGDRKRKHRARIILSDDEAEAISDSPTKIVTPESNVSDDEKESPTASRKRRIFPKRQETQERNERIRVALEVNPDLDRSEIAKIVGSGVTAQNVFDYIHHYAPQYKKPGRLKSALAEKKSRIREAFEADLISHQQGNPRKTYAEIAAIAGPDVTVGNIEIFIAKLGEEGKQFKRGQSRSEKQDAQERIRRAIQENSGKPLAEIARIAGSDVTIDSISSFKKKHKLTEKLPTKAEAEAKKKTVIAIKTANPQATAARIIELAAQQGCEVSEGMVHKYISEAGLQERRPATTKPLTQQQKDNIVRLRDAGGTFPDIATTVGCTHAQAYKHYNKDNK